MKNADRTAMPARCQSTDNPFGGLTKREVFIKDAPQVPEWFIEEFKSRDDVELLHNPKTGFTEKLSLQDRKRLWIKWRYAFASLMLDNTPV